MHEVLGLVDAIESLILESKKIPMTEKVIIEEQEILKLTDKIRLVIKTNGSVIKQSVDLNATATQVQPPQSKIEIEQNEVKEMKEGADQYADYVFSNLQLMLSKMQNQMIKLEKTIESSREIIKKKERSTNERG